MQYLLTTVESALVDLLSFGLLQPSNGEDPSRSLRMAIKELCVALLPEAIGLSDAFGFTDWELDRCARHSIYPYLAP
jgi:acyl-CoA oxidase